MIIKGNERSGARSLARHLLNAQDNEKVELHELRGFTSAENLHAAFREAETLVPHTRNPQAKAFFHAILSPPKDVTFTPEQYHHAINLLEDQYPALKTQPRAVVFHVKEGRHHAHVVWSRITPDLKLVNLWQYKKRMQEVAREITRTYGLTTLKGREEAQSRDPLTYDHAVWMQSKRLKEDPRDLKALVKAAYETSPTVEAFTQALAAHALFLAQGDKRGFVAVHHSGEVLAITRYADVKTKDLRTKYGDPARLPTVEVIKAQLPALLQAHVPRQRAQIVPEAFDRAAEPPTTTLTETWQRRQRREDKQRQADVRRATAQQLRAQRQHTRLVAWAAQVKAATQSRQFEERLAFERHQLPMVVPQWQGFAQTYAQDLARLAAQIGTLTTRLAQGGRWYTVSGQARRDRQERDALARSQAERQQRYAEACRVVEHAQAQALSLFERQQQRERRYEEQRIVAQLKTGRMPKQQEKAQGRHTSPPVRTQEAPHTPPRGTRPAPAPGQQPRVGGDHTARPFPAASPPDPPASSPAPAITPPWDRAAARELGGRERSRERNRGPPARPRIMRFFASGGALPPVRPLTPRGLTLRKAFSWGTLHVPFPRPPRPPSAWLRVVPPPHKPPPEPPLPPQPG